jgi:hypothetical protein
MKKLTAKIHFFDKLSYFKSIYFFLIIYIVSIHSIELFNGLLTNLLTG